VLYRGRMSDLHFDPDALDAKLGKRHFVDVGHAKVCYRKAGEGPALVLLVLVAS